MKKKSHAVLGFLVVWLCSGISFSMYQDGNILLGVIAVLASTIYFILVK